MVQFNEEATLFDHIRLENEMAGLLQKAVDVVSFKSLKQDSFGKQVMQEMILL